MPSDERYILERYTVRRKIHIRKVYRQAKDTYQKGIPSDERYILERYTVRRKIHIRKEYRQTKDTYQKGIPSDERYILERYTVRRKIHIRKVYRQTIGTYQKGIPSDERYILERYTVRRKIHIRKVYRQTKDTYQKGIPSDERYILERYTVRRKIHIRKVYRQTKDTYQKSIPSDERYILMLQIFGIHNAAEVINGFITSLIHLFRMFQCNQGFEDTSHIFFSCHCYVIHRGTLAGREINLLKGNTLNNQVYQVIKYNWTCIDIENKQILLLTIQYKGLFSHTSLGLHFILYLCFPEL